MQERTDKINRIRQARLLVLGAIFVAVSALVAGCSSNAADEDEKIMRIGYQKFGTLSILKSQGTLEQALDHVDTKWNGRNSLPVHSCWKL